MIPEKVLHSITSFLKEELDRFISVKGISSIRGGSINEAFKINTSGGCFFVKMNESQAFPNMFAKEVRGLNLLHDSKTLRIPKTLHYETCCQHTYLLLEYVESGNPTQESWRQFGEQLAQMHRDSNDYFGLDHDNYMGSLPQNNIPHEIWSEFFIEERLERQLKLAIDNASLDKRMIKSFEKLYSRLSTFFPPEPPALVHGDLWSGNFLFDQAGQVVLIDPAVYFGHREVDIAMSTLFGQFDDEFYHAYHGAYPMETGWKERLDIYNLYPLLIHVNLFGGGYAESVKRIIKRFI